MTKYVARSKGSKTVFACSDRINGHETIEHTVLSKARAFNSIGELQGFLGGHHKRYDAVPIEVEIKIGEPVPWLSADEMGW